MTMDKFEIDDGTVLQPAWARSSARRYQLSPLASSAHVLGSFALAYTPFVGSWHWSSLLLILTTLTSILHWRAKVAPNGYVRHMSPWIFLNVIIIVSMTWLACRTHEHAPFWHRAGSPTSGLGAGRVGEKPTVNLSPIRHESSSKSKFHAGSSKFGESSPVLATVSDAAAKDPQDVCPGYKLHNVENTRHGIVADLVLAGSACNIYGTDIDVLTLTVEYQAQDRLSVQILPKYLDASNASHHILPEDLVPRPAANSKAEVLVSSADLIFEYENDPTFTFTVRRRSTDDVLFSTTGTKLVFENQFFELATSMPKDYNLYGLGETIHGLRLGNNLTRSLFNADAPDVVDRNIYGSHPFYVETRYYETEAKTGARTLMNDASAADANKKYESLSHGVFNRNAHAQEVLLQPRKIIWRAIGGAIDLFFYAGPTVAQATAAYQRSATGLPALQQYWTFGYHQCRWGYKGWHEVQHVVDQFAAHQIPLDTVWTDLDYMDGFKDFTMNDNWGYEKGVKFTEGLTAHGQHFVPIVDSAIFVPAANDGDVSYPVFDRGNASKGFITNPDGSLYIGSVWPGYVAFPDFLGGNDWWVEELKTWHKKLNFSGIWLDMDECSSFCEGSCGSDKIRRQRTNHPTLPASGDQEVLRPSHHMKRDVAPGARDLDFPPYAINNIWGGLRSHTIGMNATHRNGYQEYDVHNLFGHSTMNATREALLQIFPEKRPFIISRSTFSGSGRWGGHWGGDQSSSFEYLYWSIPQGLSFSLFGIPMFGVDICGFGGDASEELCNRWMQLGSFFPFMRNHNDIQGSSQEPYQWPSVAAASRKSMAIRYQLLPYLYTLFYHAHTTGATVMRAMAWEFPDDPTLANADRQFFLGPAILVTPVLDEGVDTIDGVFPSAGHGEYYYDWYTHKRIPIDSGRNVTIDAPLGHIPVYVRGGYILSLQQPALTTRDARQTPWSVLVALDRFGNATGDLYLDDGESLEPDATLHVQLNAGSGYVNATSVNIGKYVDHTPLANITVMGLVDEPHHVWLNGAPLNTSIYSYASHNQDLIVHGVDHWSTEGAWAHNWTLTWK